MPSRRGASQEREPNQEIEANDELALLPSQKALLLLRTLLFFKGLFTLAMTKERTPPPPQSNLSDNINADSHPAPSLPNSPLAKRPKTTSMAAVTESSTPAITSLSQDIPPPLLVKKLVPQAQAPKRGSAFAAGYDIYAAKQTVIPARGKGLVDTGLAIAVPEGTCTL